MSTKIRELKSSPVRLLATLMLLVFTAELLVMFILAKFPPLSVAVEAFLDSAMLSILVFPLLYVLSFRPLLVHIREREEAEKELMEMRDHLEEKVGERTRELAEANMLLREEVATRKKAEGTLREREESFRTLYEQFGALLNANEDGLFLVGADRLIKWANQGAAELTGVAIGDIIGGRCDVVLNATGIPCDAGPVAESFRAKVSAHGQFSVRGGKVFDLRVFPVDYGGGDSCDFLLVVEEITEMVSLQKEAIRSAHLASLGEMAAGVAHEINNPINVIINYAQMLENRSGGSSSTGDLARRIMNEGDRIAIITESLLSFARKQPAEKKPVNLGALLDETLVLVRSQLRKENIRLEMVVPGDLPRVQANAQQLQQVFLNLVNNARQALNQKYQGSHEDKVLRISGQVLEHGLRKFATLEFLDRGTGIPGELLDKVMTPFFTTKPPGHGTGLGLSISHGIVEDHGGHIRITSEPGVQTAVAVELPVQNGSDEEVPRA